MNETHHDRRVDIRVSGISAERPLCFSGRSARVDAGHERRRLEQLRADQGRHWRRRWRCVRGGASLLNAGRRGHQGTVAEGADHQEGTKQGRGSHLASRSQRPCPLAGPALHARFRRGAPGSGHMATQNVERAGRAIRGKRPPRCGPALPLRRIGSPVGEAGPMRIASPGPVGEGPVPSGIRHGPLWED